ncbi:hypothetical protein ACFT9I_27085 [Streptomyces sp. NPDC057137]|uniref:hypothetical protein n=1 Tax=Streptomyces sp. NPDC057137 TaxID=3346030 RepID=UPI00363E8017
MEIMKKLSRIIFSVILTACGVGVMLFAATFLPQVSDWITGCFIVALFLIGVTMAWGGIAIARGANVRDIIGAILINLR